MTLTEAAAYLGISNTALRHAAEAQEVSSVHPLPLGPWIFKKEDLQTVAAQELIRRVHGRRRGAEPDAQQLALC